MENNNNIQNAQICMKLKKRVEDGKKEVFNLSTLNLEKNVENIRFLKSYPHYPNKNMCFW